MADSGGTESPLVVINSENVQNEANENSENERSEVQNAEGNEGMELETTGPETKPGGEQGLSNGPVEVEKMSVEDSNVEGEKGKDEIEMDDLATDVDLVDAVVDASDIDQIQSVALNAPENEEEMPAPADSDATAPAAKSEAQEEEGEKAEGSIQEVNVEIIADAEVKTEGTVEQGDAYMIVEEVDGDDNESSLSEEEELTENEQLRRANHELSERLALLEEFIEVEFSEKFDRFIKKRAHLVEVMGFSQASADRKHNGKRNAKSQELVGLLKIVNDQARRGHGRSPRKNFNGGNHSSPTKNGLASKDKPGTPGTTNNSNNKKEDGTSNVKQTRCHRCKALGHMVRECPLPIDPRDRKVILKKERRSDSRREKRERDRQEGVQNPTIKNMRDKRRRIMRAITRERRKMKQ